MTKPPKKKRSRSEVAEERVRVSEVMLRRAACAYAEVANLDPSDPRWRRCWRALGVAAIGMAAEIREAGSRHRRGRWCRACAARRPFEPRAWDALHA